MSKSAAYLVAAAALVLTLATGCSGKPPVISRVYARVVYVHDTTTSRSSESLGVFLVASDPDGMENLSAFYVINDDAELFWKVDSASWVTTTAEGETWIGSTSLTMPGSAPLPAGEYRVVLQSVAGDTTEDTFTVPVRTASASEAAYPSARVEGGVIRITGPSQGAEVWVYGRDGAFIAAYPANGTPDALNVQTIARSSPALAEGFSFRVYAQNERGGYAVLAGPWQSGSPAGR